MLKIGIISDTHGLLRPEALEALRGVDHILHAGDVGAPEILQRLEALAPVTAIRGNVDTDAPLSNLPATEMIDLQGTLIYMVHSIQDLDLDPAWSGIHMVVSGHSHQPRIDTHKGVLYVNPGSAGPKRFSLPISLAFANIDGPNVEATLHRLDL